MLAVLSVPIAPAAAQALAQGTIQDTAAQAAILPAPFPPPVATVVPFGAALPPPAIYLSPLAPRPAGPGVAVPSADQQDLRPPSIALDGLFAAIGAAHVFDDAKTIADAIPDEAPDPLLADYDRQKDRPGFVLKDFVAQHFSVAPRRTVSYRRRPNEGVRDYITGMWEVLSRPPDTLVAHSSLLPLPYTYVVPGGRFSEMYYWDSYFTMIGLYEDGRIDLMRSMVRDIASLIDRYGHMPNGNRTYYLSRSEPPFFALMVDLLAMHDGQVAYTNFLPELQREYDYWMDGAAQTAPGAAYRRVVRLPDGTVMNRHWDDLSTPRDESYPEDIATATATNRPAAEVYRDLRAGAETGWDYSSRWLADGHTLSSIHTTDLLTVELNCLIAHLEQTLSHAYALNGNTSLSDRYAHEATARIDAIRRVLWDDRQGAFFDYDWKKGALSPVLSGATVMPLFLQMATPDQAQAVAATLRARLLKIGGLTTTDRVSGQQWDSPNGWAPTQWMAIKGLNQYGIDDLAQEIATRWMGRVIGTYEKSGVLLEKYDVVNPVISPTGGKGGGEYPMQVGFGWTNGTLLGLMNRYPQDTRVVLDRNPRADQPPAQPLPPFNAYDVKGPANDKGPVTAARVSPAPVPAAPVPASPVPPVVASTPPAAVPPPEQPPLRPSTPEIPSPAAAASASSPAGSSSAPSGPVSGPADAAQAVQGHDGDGQQDRGPRLVHGAGPGGHDQQQGSDPQRVLDQHGPAQ
ncbi:alpha,alpha-trehalase TreF [Gluconacetobacter tumulisoli]|uniref:Alpha,alpha-trehalase TreF n=1 Tax=Gluconacetobacter tumulisoli TaxID=1286189 RepID=A0A7W4K8A1_9PROT|nr:alpha,alpha-trehalase TreF [Gluconacetobacter tumulisoli]